MRTVPNARRSMAALAITSTLVIAACTATEPDPEPEAEPDFDQIAEELRACPEGDGLWRRAGSLAAAEERTEELIDLTASLTDLCPRRWEPPWTEGRTLLSVGRPEESRPAFEEGLRRARALSDPVGIARNSNKLGWLSFTSGDLERGRTLFESAIEHAITAERTDLTAFFRNNYAGLLMDQGDFADAREQFEAAEKALQELEMTDAARSLAYNRAVILLELGDALGAEQLLQEVVEDATKADDRWSVDAASIVLGNLHLALFEPTEAKRRFRQVSAEDDDLKQLAALGLGRAAIQEDRPAEAIEILSAATSGAKEGERLYAATTEAFLADAEMRAGELERSRERLEQLLKTGGDELPAESAWQVRWLLGRNRMLAGEHGDAIPLLREATGILEENSARLDPLGGGMSFLRERSDPYAELAVALVERDGPSRTDTDALFEVIRQAQARALQHVLTGDAPTASTKIEQIRGDLASDELLVNFVLGERRGVLLAVGRDVLRAHPIAGRRTLLDALSTYRDALRKPILSGSAPGEALDLTDDERAAGGTLFRELLGPIADLLSEASRLYVVPDRELALVPFSALPLPDGAGYLGHRHEVAVLPLAGAPGDWTELNTPVLLAGQPVLQPDSGFSELPWAAQELADLREIWGEKRTTYLGAEQLSLQGLDDVGLDRFKTLHLATHAVASTRDPRRCAVILSNDERLGIDEIIELELAPSLVVLSACRTGEGELLPGQGVIGLGWAFLLAGAEGVVVSHWTVDDRASADLMARFHTHLDAGQPPVRALARARREVAERYPHPAYWAAFELVRRGG